MPARRRALTLRLPPSRVAASLDLAASTAVVWAHRLHLTPRPPPPFLRPPPVAGRRPARSRLARPRRFDSRRCRRVGGPSRFGCRRREPLPGSISPQSTSPLRQPSSPAHRLHLTLRPPPSFLRPPPSQVAALVDLAPYLAASTAVVAGAQAAPHASAAAVASRRLARPASPRSTLPPRQPLLLARRQPLTLRLPPPRVAASLDLASLDLAAPTAVVVGAQAAPHASAAAVASRRLARPRLARPRRLDSRRCRRAGCILRLGRRCPPPAADTAPAPTPPHSSRGRIAWLGPARRAPTAPRVRRNFRSSSSAACRATCRCGCTRREPKSSSPSSSSSSSSSSPDTAAEAVEAEAAEAEAAAVAGSTHRLDLDLAPLRQPSSPAHRLHLTLRPPPSSAGRRRCESPPRSISPRSTSPLRQPSLPARRRPLTLRLPPSRVAALLDLASLDFAAPTAVVVGLQAVPHASALAGRRLARSRLARPGRFDKPSSPARRLNLTLRLLPLRVASSFQDGCPDLTSL